MLAPTPNAHGKAEASAPLTLIDALLAEQRELTAVEEFARAHDRHEIREPHYKKLLPATAPVPGQQYAFEVDLDKCSGCKACVTACHSLNGLDDDEAWRETGTLVSHDWRRPFQQTITTACHHCVDPGCLNGCPVLAYEKDAVTGIVQHLDDQCIGCEYCVMTIGENAMKKHPTPNSKLQENLNLQAPESWVVMSAHRLESGAWSLELAPHEHAHA